MPANSLVLLVSGGEVLHSDNMVSSYSAGTDTNPIYMFSKPSVKENNLNKSSKSDNCFITLQLNFFTMLTCLGFHLFTKSVNRLSFTNKNDTIFALHSL